MMQAQCAPRTRDAAEEQLNGVQMIQVLSPKSQHFKMQILLSRCETLITLRTSMKTPFGIIESAES